MFTYKFEGLNKQDATTPYYYGSLPAEAKAGQILRLDETGNRYRIVLVIGKGLEGKGGEADQRELAFADIGGGKKVPTLYLSEVTKSERKGVKIFGKAPKVGDKKHGKGQWSVNFSKKPSGKPSVIVKEFPVDGGSWDEARLLKWRSQQNKKQRFQKPKKS